MADENGYNDCQSIVAIVDSQNLLANGGCVSLLCGLKDNNRSIDDSRMTTDATLTNGCNSNFSNHELIANTDLGDVTRVANNIEALSLSNGTEPVECHKSDCAKRDESCELVSTGRCLDNDRTEEVKLEGNHSESEPPCTSEFRELSPDDRQLELALAKELPNSEKFDKVDHTTHAASPLPSCEAAESDEAHDGCCGCSGHEMPTLMSHAARKRCRKDTSDSAGSVQEYIVAGCDVVFKDGIEYRAYGSEQHLQEIIDLVSRDLSEPYTIYTYRYFINNWPNLCIRALDVDRCIGAIVCKLHIYQDSLIRGYIAMLAVDKEYRRRGIGTQLVLCAIKAMIEDDCDDVILETEIDNSAALRLYENLGFIRDKRLHKYYLNGRDAFRLHLLLD